MEAPDNSSSNPTTQDSSAAVPSTDPMAASAQGMMDAGGAQPNTVSMPGGVSAGPKPQTPAAASTPPPQRTGFFDRMLEVLGGGPKKTYTVNQDTGALEEHQSQDTRGNLAKHVIAGMLSGLAAGAKEHGPGAALRGFSAGAEASMDLNQAQEQQKKIQAEKDSQNLNAKQLRDFATTKWNFEKVMMERTAEHQDGEFWDRHNESQIQMGKILDDLNAQRVPVMVNGKDVNDGDTPENDADLMRAYTAGQIKAGPGARLLLLAHDSPEGKGRIFHVYSVPEDAMNKTVPVTPDIKAHWPALAQVSQVQFKTLLNLGAKAMDDHNDDVNRQLKEQQIKTQRAEQSKNQAETAEINERTRQMREGATTADDFGNVSTLPPKELLKRQDTFQKDVVNKAYDVEKSFQMMQRAYGEYVDAASHGHSLPTGAQSMLALSTHLATTFGNVKGSRVTKDMIREHLGARSIGDEALVAMQRLTNGDQLSSQQWKAFNDLVGQSRNETWKNAISMAKDQKIGIGFLPRGNGQTPVDRNTAQLYVDAAEGNMQKAADALKKRGWLLPTTPGGGQ